MGKTAFQKYNDHERIARQVHNNTSIASSNQGTIQFNHAFLDLERTCNLRCDGCYEFLSESTGARLSFNEVKDVVDYAKSNQARVMIIAGAGEPTLDPDFKKIITYIPSVGMGTVLFTNGTTMNPKIADFLISHQVSPLVKLLSENPKIHDSITRVKGTHTKVKEAVKHLIKSKDKQDYQVTIGIECYVSQSNIEEIPRVLKFCRTNELQPYIEAFVETGQSSEQKENSCITQERLDKLFRDLQQIDAEYNISTTLIPGSPVYGGRKCNKGLASFAVHEDGLVTACAVKNDIFGNIRNKPLAEILDLSNPLVKAYYSGSGCNACSLQFRG